MPLALADASSIARGDLVTADLVYSDRTGEIYHGLYNPAHRWFLLPGDGAGRGRTDQML